MRVTLSHALVGRSVFCSPCKRQFQCYANHENRFDTQQQHDNVDQPNRYAILDGLQQIIITTITRLEIH